MDTKIISKTLTVASNIAIEAIGNKGRVVKHKRKHRQNHNMVDKDPSEKQGVVEHQDNTQDLDDKNLSKKNNKTKIKVKEVSPGITIPANDTEDNQQLQVTQSSILEELTAKSSLPQRGLNKDNQFIEHLNAITSVGDVIDSMFKKMKKGAFTNKNHKKIVTILTRMRSDCSKLEGLF